jgi:hypothetical protein
MSVIPEILLQRVIVNGYRELRKDPRLLDSIFRNLTQKQLSAVKQFLMEVRPQFSINYPRQDLKVPSLVLILKNESENVPFLGDSMQTVAGPDAALTYDTLGGHGGSVSGLQGLPAKLLGPLEVVSSDGATVRFLSTTALGELVENPVGSILAYVVSGTGSGQVHPIVRIRSDALDIVGTFDPYLDSTSRIDIRSVDASEMPLGEPSRVYDAGNRRNLRCRGAEYEVTYHLHVIAGGQDEVIFLYSALKALLLSQRPLLEAQGIINLRIAGSDFAPRTEYLPSEVFQRMMVLTFTYPFSFIEELDLPDKLILNVIPDDPVTGEPCDTPIFGVTIQL